MGGGGLLLVAVLAWAFGQLNRSDRALRRRGEDLARANRELAFVAKTSALGAISAHLIHDLKNPLAGLAGFVGDEAAGTAGSGDDEAWREAVQTAQRLRAMVPDIAALLARRSGREFFAFDAGGNRDRGHPAPSAETAARTGCQDWSPRLAPRVRRSRGREANLGILVLANLLDNACKASPRGADVRLSAQAGNQRLEFLVTDRGMGIPRRGAKGTFPTQDRPGPGGSGLGCWPSNQQLARHAGGLVELARTWARRDCRPVFGCHSCKLSFGPELPPLVPARRGRGEHTKTRPTKLGLGRGLAASAFSWRTRGGRARRESTQEIWLFAPTISIESSPAARTSDTEPIYIGSDAGPNSYDVGYLFAINPTTEKAKWIFDQIAGPVESTPAIGPDGTVYFGSDGTVDSHGNVVQGGTLYGLNPSSGALLGSFATGGYIYSSPAIGQDGTIYVGSGDGSLYAIQPSPPNYQKKWSFPTGGNIDSSPAIGPDGTIYVGSWDGGLYAVTPDGQMKWRFPTKDRIVASPAIATDGTIYVGSKDGYLYALTPGGNPKWAFATDW